MNCSWIKCATFPIETYLDNVLIWHRDATHTSCPWEKLYEQIQQIRTNLTTETTWLTLKYIQNSKKELKNLLLLIDLRLEQKQSYESRKKLQIPRLTIRYSL